MLDKSYYLYDQGNFRESLENNLATIKLAEQYGDYDVAHNSYSYLGYDYLVLEDTLRALESFEKSHYYARKTRDPILIANAYTDFAQLYAQDSATYDKGIHYFKNALIIYHKERDSIGLQGSYYDYASILFQREDERQFPVIMDSLSKYTEIADVGPRFKAMAYILQAKSQMRDNDLKEAESTLSKSIALTKKEGQRELLEESYSLYSEVLRRRGNFLAAYEMLYKYDSLNRINQKTRRFSESKRIAARFEADKKEKEIQKANLETELAQEKVKQRTLTNYLLAGIIVIGIGSIIILFYIARRRKSFIKTLEYKNQQVVKAKKEAERLAKVKSNFFSTVSHELRTPLYGVIGLSSILLEKNKDKENFQDLQSLKFSADYLLALINDVLHLNKIDSSQKLDKEDDVFNVNELLDNIISSFEYIRIQNDNTIETVYDVQLPHLIKGNSTQLSQILMNLVGNACKFTENGKIRVELKAITTGNTSTIEFSVADTGHGIAKNKIKHIFEEFAQGESKNNTYQGTGLGLSIVKKLLHAAGSKIKVESELGKGSKFSFQMTYEVVQEKVTLKKQHVKNIYSPKLLNGARILIVEDNKINQMVTRKILEKDGVICEVAENGKVAIDKVKEQCYDLVLMDVNMPVMDGIEATQEIRKFNAVPIVALTAVELEEMREKIYSSGMDDIIVKPYDVKQFQQSILHNIEKGSITRKGKEILKTKKPKQ
ncbi:sensory box histidine kinase/response regulator [Nonlabens marinus S1-08]|uniref:histidine kinase n=2 Tax=Nonlabens TaxID=363408 RepID=W8VNG4_9FLAO|nr:sensory box histidine kinase/response regulator [Nonlabens marinus S1-08]